MQEKTYSQMKKDFVQFYYDEIRDRLPKYTTMRRNEGTMQLLFWLVWCSFLLIFAFMLWFQFVSPAIIKIIPQIETFNIVVKILFGIDIAICVISLPTMIIWDSNTSNSTNTSGSTRYIKSDLEMELKRTLMPKFVKIFFDDGFWVKQSSYSSQTSNYYSYQNDRDNAKSNSIENLRELKILNPYPWARYEDIITGTFKNVKIRINEVNTKILRFIELAIILFFFIWLIGFTGGIFLLIFLVFFLPAILISALIFISKIRQYSLFRGVIVEFDMNKNFKGHTIFHENSLLAKKIPLNKNNYTKVNLESVTFENKYNVYSTDQIEARYILTPALIERIENLKFAFKAKYVRGSFKDNKLTLAIHTGKDMFAMGNDFKDSDIHTFEMLYDEMISVLQIVDELKLNEHTGL